MKDVTFSPIPTIPTVPAVPAVPPISNPPPFRFKFVGSDGDKDTGDSEDSEGPKDSFEDEAIIASLVFSSVTKGVLGLVDFTGAIIFFNRKYRINSSKYGFILYILFRI